ncbi:hypothetical protein HMI55_002038 [Coelomomyces lativittatus]|nr:hypothetical protein HMI55_002038 [Coelomomyces lativittatus]KAJ1510610.1 hypothetical protein HMI56_006259 [Coelomomyces lativittatus]
MYFIQDTSISTSTFPLSSYALLNTFLPTWLEHEPLVCLEWMYAWVHEHTDHGVTLDPTFLTWVHTRVSKYMDHPVPIYATLAKLLLAFCLPHLRSLTLTFSSHQLRSLQQTCIQFIQEMDAKDLKVMYQATLDTVNEVLLLHPTTPKMQPQNKITFTYIKDNNNKKSKNESDMEQSKM